MGIGRSGVVIWKPGMKVMVSLRLWLAMRLRVVLSVAFWVMDVVDVLEAAVCLLVRQAGIRSIIIMMHINEVTCFVSMGIMALIMCFTLVYAQRECICATIQRVVGDCLEDCCWLGCCYFGVWSNRY